MEYARKGEHLVHLRSEPPGVFKCDQYTYSGKSQVELEMHARREGQTSFICTADKCEKKFSRIHPFQRHLRAQSKDNKRHACKYCKKYRGANGFKRKYHLTQHIRNYHHIADHEDAIGPLIDRAFCPRESCASSRFGRNFWGPERVFEKSAEWIKHMRTIHQECGFPYPKAGCDRVNGKGYLGQADPRAHLRKVHSVSRRLEGDW